MEGGSRAWICGRLMWCLLTCYRVENPGQVAIQDRLKVLAWALKTCKFGPERENIEGSIRAYEDGEIGYTSHYTTLYAGKVVDTAPNYGSFVGDRQERLDRYFEAHGPHWIWFEPPLKVDPEAKPKMLGSVALHRLDSYTNLGAWHVTQGFWKRSKWVRRMKATANVALSHLEPMFEKQADGRVFCQDAGPKQAFRSILDSGATYPSLYQADFQKLMIDEHNYAAQSVETLDTPNGVMYSRLFELFVCVLDGNRRQLVDANHCAHPYYAKYLGGLCPVAEVQGVVKYDVTGHEISQRLSGLLPFLACYISSTPSRNTMYLGEDRKDVLGSHRMLGARKWDIAMPTCPPSDISDTERAYGDPKTTFSHRQGQIVDQDDPDMDFASTITIYQGTSRERSERNCPKEQMEAIKAKEARMRREAADEVVAQLTNVIKDRPEVVKAMWERQEEERLQQEQEQAAPAARGFQPPKPVANL